MAEFPALPLWTDAFLGDTIHLNAEETGAYLMLLMVMWRTGDCTLPDDDVKLARWARCSPKAWSRIRPTILEFLSPIGDRWTQKRLKDERTFVEEKKQRAAENGRASALKRKGRHSTERVASDIASDQQTVNKTPTPTPTPHTHVKERETNVSPKKGTRIAPNWQPTRPLPDAVGELVRQWPEGRLERELEQFRDYWTSRSKDATKLDWDRAWWNRIRDQHDRIMREANFAANRNNGSRAGKVDGFSLALDRAERATADWEADDDRGSIFPHGMGQP